jgi:hypothetical protein
MRSPRNGAEKITSMVEQRFRFGTRAALALLVVGVLAMAVCQRLGGAAPRSWPSCIAWRWVR